MEGYLLRLVAWSKLKARLHLQTDSKIVYFSEREIWWASVGLNIGLEQNGKNCNFERPVLVFKKFAGNIAWIIPITSKTKVGPYYFPIHFHKKTYFLILSQLRLVSSRRLLRKIRVLSITEFKEVKAKLKGLI